MTSMTTTPSKDEVPSAFGHSESLASVMEKYGSENHALKAEGLMRMILFSRTNSFVADDEALFGSLVRDFADSIELEVAQKNALAEKYGDNIPPEIEQAKMIGMMESSDMGVEYFARIQQAGIDVGPTYKELKESIENSGRTDDEKADLLADVEQAYVQGQQQAQVMINMMTALEQIGAPKPADSLSHNFDGQNPDDGIGFEKARSEMCAQNVDTVSSTDNTLKPVDPINSIV